MTAQPDSTTRDEYIATMWTKRPWYKIEDTIQHDKRGQEEDEFKSEVSSKTKNK